MSGWSTIIRVCVKSHFSNGVCGVYSTLTLWRKLSEADPIQLCSNSNSYLQVCYQCLRFQRGSLLHSNLMVILIKHKIRDLHTKSKGLLRYSGLRPVMTLYYIQASWAKYQVKDCIAPSGEKMLSYFCSASSAIKIGKYIFTGKSCCRRRASRN